MLRRAPRVCGDDPVLVGTKTAGVVVLPAYAGMIPRDFGKEIVEGLCSPRMRG